MRTLKVLLIATILFVSVSAHSVTHFNCNGGWAYWNSNPTFLLATNDGFPIGSALRNQIVDAGSEFDQISDVARSISFGNTAAMPSLGINGSNEIWDDDLPIGTAAHARLYLPTSCTGSTSQLSEVDLRFDLTDWNWTTNPWNEFNTSLAPMKNAAMHELGHGMGLDHDYSQLAVMNQRIPDGAHFGAVARQTYHSDDREGFRQIYGDGTEELNVAASAYWYDTTSSPSQTIFVRPINLMTSYNGFELSDNSTMNTAPFSISIGGWYRWPYVIENHSTSSEDVRVRLYASLNGTIDTINDILIDSSLYSMGASTEHAAHRVFQLPASLTSGSIYTFGYIIDRPYNSNADGYSGDDDTVVYNMTHLVN